MIALTMDRVAKRYKVRRPGETNAGRRSLRQKLTGFARRPEEFWALRDVSFEVAEGETLGIIGHNGAGKSTILKLLSSVTVPTCGEIRIRGRLSALIEVGAGFHQELTGRENIYLSGSVLGMRRREISDKLERIIEFAGVRDFIDTPVKHYSSGMYLRLGFAIAAHLEPDILLLDEVLAVGDAAFQSKCLDRISELHRQGRTIVFISHDLAAVERLCDRVILLKKGQIAATGTPAEVIARYQNVTDSYAPSESHSIADSNRSREVEIISVTCHDGRGESAAVFRTGARAKVQLSYVVHSPVADAVFDIHVSSAVDSFSELCCQLTTASREGLGMRLPTGAGMVEFAVDEIGLQPGMYYVSAMITHADPAIEMPIDRESECLLLRIDQGRFVQGTFYMPHRWHVTAGLASSGDAPETIAQSVGH